MESLWLRRLPTTTFPLPHALHTESLVVPIDASRLMSAWGARGMSMGYGSRPKRSPSEARAESCFSQVTRSANSPLLRIAPLPSCLAMLVQQRRLNTKQVPLVCHSLWVQREREVSLWWFLQAHF